MFDFLTYISSISPKIHDMLLYIVHLVLIILPVRHPSCASFSILKVSVLVVDFLKWTEFQS